MSKTKYFKVFRGFNESDFIPIDQSELEKAIYAQISGKVAILKNGTIAGNQIGSIVPDYHRAKGWNYGYKLQAEDWKEINRDCKSYTGIIEIAKNRVEYFIKSGKQDLIGKDVDIKQLN